MPRKVRTWVESRPAGGGSQARRCEGGPQLQRSGILRVRSQIARPQAGQPLKRRGETWSLPPYESSTLRPDLSRRSASRRSISRCGRRPGGLGMIGARCSFRCSSRRWSNRRAHDGRLRRELPDAVSRPAGVDVAARRARVVEFFYGEPDANWSRGHASAHGELAGRVARGSDRGRARGLRFHRGAGNRSGRPRPRNDQPASALVQVLEVVRVPVVAAGGIATARDLAAVLACGAAGARIGTRFAASAESGAHPAYVEALLGASAADTCLTEAYSVMWLDAPRVLRRRLLHRKASPTASSARWTSQARSFRSNAIRDRADVWHTGRIDAMALYAGESSRTSRKVPGGDRLGAGGGRGATASRIVRLTEYSRRVRTRPRCSARPTAHRGLHGAILGDCSCGALRCEIDHELGPSQLSLHTQEDERLRVQHDGRVPASAGTIARPGGGPHVLSDAVRSTSAGAANVRRRPEHAPSDAANFYLGADRSNESLAASFNIFCRSQPTWVDRTAAEGVSPASPAATLERLLAGGVSRDSAGQVPRAAKWSNLPFQSQRAQRRSL